jgi:hypothetical protein
MGRHSRSSPSTLRIGRQSESYPPSNYQWSKLQICCTGSMLTISHVCPMLGTLLDKVSSHMSVSMEDERKDVDPYTVEAKHVEPICMRQGGSRENKSFNNSLLRTSETTLTSRWALRRRGHSVRPPLFANVNILCCT